MISQAGMITRICNIFNERLQGQGHQALLNMESQRHTDLSITGFFNSKNILICLLQDFLTQSVHKM